MQIGDEVTSKVIQVDKKQKGVRTAIPSHVRKTLKLEVGDTLKWNVLVENEELYVKISKKQD